MTTFAQPSATDQPLVHPGFCHSLPCFNEGADLVHEEKPVEVKAVSGRPAISVGLVRVDEVFDEGQIVYPSNLVVQLGDAETVLDGAGTASLSLLVTSRAVAENFLSSADIAALRALLEAAEGDR